MKVIPFSYETEVAGAPVRFESEYPAAAAALQRLGGWQPRSLFRALFNFYFFLDGNSLPLRSKITPKLDRNGPCGCGSQLKFKKCCQPIL